MTVKLPVDDMEAFLTFLLKEYRVAVSYTHLVSTHWQPSACLIVQNSNIRSRHAGFCDDSSRQECIYFDEAYERGMKLQQVELPKLDVNMFAAIDNSLINDGCGL